MKSGRKSLYFFLLLFTTLYSRTIYFPKAKLSYNFYENQKSIYSNDINIDPRVEFSTIEFFKYSKNGKYLSFKRSKYKKDATFYEYNLPKIDSKTISLDNVKVEKTSSIFNENSYFLEVKDSLANINKNGFDEILVTIKSDKDFEILKLYEIGKNSGIFRGYFQTTKKKCKNFDGLVYIKPNTKIIISTDKVSKYLLVNSYLRSLTSYQNKNIWLQNLSNENRVSSGEVFCNKVSINNSSSSSVGSIFSIKLEKGLKYISGSLRVDGKKISAKNLGRRVFFNLIVSANKQCIVSYNVKAGFSKQTTLIQKIEYAKNILEIKSIVDDDFMQDGSLIVGKVAFGTKGIKGVKIYLENGISTITDRNGRYHFEGIKPDFHVVKIVTDSIDKRFKITSCSQNIRYAGSKTSQFVDSSISHISRADFCVKYEERKSNKKKKKNIKKKKKKIFNMPKYTKASFSQKENKILWPPHDFVPPFPSVKIAFMHEKNLKYKVFINNKEVDKLAYDGFEISKEKDFKIEKYRGVQLSDGDNTLKIELLKEDKIIKVLKENIHFSTSPTKAVIVEDLSKLRVDDTSSAIIAVRLYDKDGFVVRKGMIGKCSINEPYYFADKKIGDKGVFFIKDNKKYIVEDDGIVYLKLKPTSVSGAIKIRFDFMDDGEFLNSWLNVEQKHWVIVGFAKGSFGYNTIEKNLDKISSTKDYKNSKISLFAKGKISSDTILTIAYNSAKKVDLTKLENSDLKKSYLVFADSSKQQNEAPSSKKLYLKLERKNFYALFGDFKTGFDTNQLAKYDITVTGLKSQYNGDKFSYKSFVSNSKNIHIKEELKPDGTSGKYYLKYKNIVENSDEITIVTRDKDNFDKVIKEEKLYRDIDYNLDYHDGSIYFKDFQFSTDSDFNKKYIVVDYEINPKNGDNKNLTYGLRVKMKAFKNISVGTTYVKSKRGLDESELKGIDVMLQIYKNIDINLEGSKTKEADKEAKAHYEKVKYHKKSFALQISHSYIEKDFGIENQENIRDVDNKINSIKASYDIGKHDRVIVKNDKKESISTKEKEDRNSLEYYHKGSDWKLKSGYKIIRKDSIKDKKALFGVSKNFLNSSITTSFSKVKSLDKSLLEADESIFKVTYLLKPSVKLFAQSRISELNSEKTKEYKGGIITNLWSGASANLALTHQIDKDTKNSDFANYGMIQNLNVSKNLNFLLGYDAKKSLKGIEKLDDYKTYNAKMNFKKDKLNYKVQMEYKDSKEDKLNSSFSVNTKLNNNYAVAFGLRNNQVFGRNSSSEVDCRSVLAYRPNKEKLIVLNKTDIKSKKSSNSKTEKIVNNIYFDTFLSDDISISGQVGLKYFKTHMDDKTYSDLVGLLGGSFNYDITKKMSIKSQASMTFTLGGKTYEYSAGSSIGYSPMKDSVVYLGYNVEGFKDSDFESDTYRDKGTYVNFLLKFDEYSLAERAKRSVK